MVPIFFLLWYAWGTWQQGQDADEERFTSHPASRRADEGASCNTKIMCQTVMWQAPRQWYWHRRVLSGWKGEEHTLYLDIQELLWVLLFLYCSFLSNAAIPENRLTIHFIAVHWLQTHLGAISNVSLGGILVSWREEVSLWSRCLWNPLACPPWRVSQFRT